MGTFPTNALPWSHFPTFGLIDFVFAKHCHRASYFALLSCKAVPPHVESVHSTVVGGLPLCCVVFCCRFEPLPAELPW